MGQNVLVAIGNLDELLANLPKTPAETVAKMRTKLAMFPSKRLPGADHLLGPTVRLLGLDPNEVLAVIKEVTWGSWCEEFVATVFWVDLAFGDARGAQLDADGVLQRLFAAWERSDGGQLDSLRRASADEARGEEAVLYRLLSGKFREAISPKYLTAQVVGPWFRCHLIDGIYHRGALPQWTPAGGYPLRYRADALEEFAAWLRSFASTPTSSLSDTRSAVEARRRAAVSELAETYTRYAEALHSEAEAFASDQAAQRREEEEQGGKVPVETPTSERRTGTGRRGGAGESMLMEEIDNWAVTSFEELTEREAEMDDALVGREVQDVYRKCLSSDS
eukprot:Selendium_serpulae@DN5125_c3_g1_i1.p1